jgi:Pyruvate/2-oxoacid:ferredoxin oxidoreductase delta subunit
MASKAHEELCERMMVPGSQRLLKVWEILCDETDAKLILAMPATATALAQATGLPLAEVQSRIDELYHRGVVFEKEKPDGTVYRGARHLIQLHDASVQWPEATQAYFDAWVDFMENEYPPLLKMMMEAGLPSFMRTIPVSGTIGHLSDVSANEDVERMIENAKQIAIVRCPCRLSAQNCDNEVETCVQFDRGATYNIKRGTGHEITKEQALDIVQQSEKAGLVHTVENRDGLGNVLCNCCNDCCAIILPYLKGGSYRRILAPSRFRPNIDADACLQDGHCVDGCPVSALTLESGDDAPTLDPDQCIGCGLCVNECPVAAIRLLTVHPPEFLAGT